MDEVGTLNALKAIRRELADPAIAAHHGRVVKTTGDGILVEFPSVVDAVACAVAIQEGMVARNADVPEDKRIVFRIGINIGDIIIDEADIHGDGVNVAARLEALADPGGICIADDAYRQVRGKIEATFVDMGEQALKNIAQPVRAWQIGMGRGSASQLNTTVRPKLPLPDKPSLAVLPFQNMSGDPDQEYFADGMVEEITTALSRVRSFFVIARNSSFTYKGKTVDVKQVGRELGVRYVLEGSVRRAGGRVRITGQLVEAETGAHLWADRYDGSLDDIFDLQDSVTRSVVGAISPKLQRAEIERAFRKRTEDLSAYDLVLRAQPYAWSLTREKNAEALDLLVKATALDPTYAYAFASIALCILIRKNAAWPPWQPDQDQLCLRFAREAIKLDPGDPAVLWTSGMAIGNVNRETEYAMELIDRSLAIDPNSALAWLAKGASFCYVGRGDDGIAAVENALRLSPFDPLIFLFTNMIAECHSAEKRHELAIEWSLRALRESPTPMPTTLRTLAGNYARMGRLDEAKAAVKGILEANPTFTVSKWLAMSALRGPHKCYIADSYRLAGLPE
jgi:adenylate cyclase